MARRSQLGRNAACQEKGRRAGQPEAAPLTFARAGVFWRRLYPYPSREKYRGEDIMQLSEVEELEEQGLAPRSRWSRRGFVMTSLATGFALSVQPVSAQTITTDTAGLDAGEVKVKTKEGEIPAYRAMPDKGGPVSDDPHRARSLGRPRAHQGSLPASGQGGILRDRAGGFRAAGQCGGDDEDGGYRQADSVGPRCAGDVRS